MKKTLLSLAAGLVLTTGAIAQNITINVSGSATDISGQTHTYELSTAVSDEHLVDFEFNNISGVSQSWIITRRNLNQPAGWDNFFCWGISGQIGNCYASTPDEYFDSGNLTVPDGQTGLVSTYVTSPGSGTSTYRYYVSTDGTTYLDSVDLQVVSVAGVNDIQPNLTVNIAPNPASDFVNISAEGVDGATVRIMDVLGNKIMTSKITGTKTIDVTEYRNGIYFIIVESQGVKTVNRKVIIRH